MFTYHNLKCLRTGKDNLWANLPCIQAPESVVGKLPVHKYGMDSLSLNQILAIWACKNVQTCYIDLALYSRWAGSCGVQSWPTMRSRQSRRQKSVHLPLRQLYQPKAQRNCFKLVQSRVLSSVEVDAQFAHIWDQSDCKINIHEPAGFISNEAEYGCAYDTVFTILIN